MATADAQEVQNVFKKHFSHSPAHVVRAPGRLELLGNHTDYNDGLVMSLAVDRYISIASEPRADGKIELISSEFPERDLFRVDDLKKDPAAPWADYVKGVLDQLRKRGVHFSGFNAAINGTIPIGAGMSSSAALEVATALTVRRLYPFGLSATGLTTAPARDAKGELPPIGAAERLELAKLCRAAENEFVGVKCGILDQISSLFGKAWSVIDIDCRSLNVEHAPMPGEAIIVCNSGVKHSLVGGEYNELRQNCESAAKKLDAKSLRSVELKQVEAGEIQTDAARIRMRPPRGERDCACGRGRAGVARGRSPAVRTVHVPKPRKLARFSEEQHEGTRPARGTGAATSRLSWRAADGRRFWRRDHQSRGASSGGDISSSTCHANTRSAQE